MTRLNEKQLSELKFMLMDELFTEIDDANEKNRLQEFLCRTCSKEFCDKRCAKYFVNPDKKILVIGEMRIGKHEMLRIAEDYCICENQIEIINKYKELSRFDFDNLIHSKKYSDIIFAAVPHKTKGTNSSSGIIAHILNNQNCYPNMIIARAGGQIKLTAASFSRALQSTVLYQNLCM